jgi:Tfp pilus assembly protein PilF
VLEVLGRNDGSQVWIGQKGPFGLPLRTFIPAGRHRLVLHDASGAEKSLEVEIAAAATRVIDTAAAQAPSPSLALSGAPLSAPSLLAEARHEMSLGHPRAALALYKKLRAAFPASPEAATVLVTMAKLELNLGSPAPALTDFDVYLKSGGPLAPEAMAGKIRALRALGRSADEQAAIEQYLGQYPNGFEARAFEQRLRVLRGQ